MFLSVERPRRIEDLMTTMLGVGLREHHQLDVIRIAIEVIEALVEIFDLVLGEREAQALIRLRQGDLAATQDIDDL